MALNQAALAAMDPNRAAIAQKAAQMAAAQRTADQQAALNAYRKRLAALGGAPSPGGPQNPAPGVPGGPATTPSSGGGGAGTKSTLPGNLPTWLGGGGNATMGIDQIIQDPAKLSWLFKQAGLTGDLQAQLQAAMGGYNAAGVNQWNSNLTRTEAMPGQPAALQNVGMDTDINALRRMVGEITGMMTRGQDPKSLYAQRQAMINPAAQEAFKASVGDNIYQQLIDTAGGQNYGPPGHRGTNEANSISAGPNAGRGLRWLPELLADPGINMTDPTKPLFDPAHPPPSLSQLTGFQAGESAMLASMTPEQFWQQILPKYLDYFHRAPGSEAPGLGPMFGEQSYDSNLSGNFVTQQGDVLGNPVKRGWLTETPAYAQWSAMGQPSRASDGTVHDAYGASFNPITGEGNPGQGQPGNGFAKALLAGQVNPGMFAEYNYNPNASWEDSPYFVENMILPALGRVGTAAFLGNPQYYFDSQPAGANLDPATIQRMLALANGSKMEVS